MKTIEQLVSMSKAQLSKYMFDQKIAAPRPPYSVVQAINCILEAQGVPLRLESPKGVKLEQALSMGLVKYGGQPYPEAGTVAPVSAPVQMANEVQDGIKGDVEKLIDRLIKRGAKTEVFFQVSKTEQKPVKLHILGKPPLRYRRGVWLPIEDRMIEVLEHTTFLKPTHVENPETGKVEIKMIPVHRYNYNLRPLQARG